MFAILHALGMFVADMFTSRRRLEAENLFLRHQLNISLRRAPPRLRLRASHRALLIWMNRLWPSPCCATDILSSQRPPVRFCTLWILMKYGCEEDQDYKYRAMTRR
jgi:hypothetical protein